MSFNKGGKKGRKGMLAAARLDPTITVIPNRVVDMVTLVQQIRRFIADVGGPMTMSLPPTNKETRKNVHEMAVAFNLRSVSKGKGDARYTTLSKTTKSGIYVDEKKVAKIVRRSSGRGGGGEFMGSNPWKDRGQGKPVVPRHKDGDEVGKVCLKHLIYFTSVDEIKIFSVGCAEDWSIECWVQNVGAYGLVGG